MAQSGPFGAVKMLDETRPELRGEVVLAFAGETLRAGFDEDGLQLLDQFLFLLWREVSHCFENFGHRAHARKNTAPGCGVQAESNPSWRRTIGWQRSRLHPDGSEDVRGGPRSLRRFAAEAWRRADAGGLADEELDPCAARCA